MVQKGKLIMPATVAVGFLYYILSTPPTFDMSNYAVGLAIIYSLAFKAVADETEKYFVLVGYLFWTLAYLLQIYYGFERGLSTWPLFSGAYYLVNEYLTCCTRLYEDGKYVTPIHVRIGYYIYAGLDLILNMMTVYLGTGSDYDELGLFPMKTMDQRMLGFATYCAIVYVVQHKLANAFGPRQAKYQMMAFQYLCHASSVRLPAFRDLHSHAGLANIMKFQIFGSACYVVITKKPCNPQILFRVYFWLMVPFCAFATTAGYAFFNDLDIGTFRTMCASFMMGFWVLLVSLTKYFQTNTVQPLQQRTDASPETLKAH